MCMENLHFSSTYCSYWPRNIIFHSNKMFTLGIRDFFSISDVTGAVQFAFFIISTSKSFQCFNSVIYRMILWCHVSLGVINRWQTTCDIYHGCKRVFTVCHISMDERLVSIMCSSAIDVKHRFIVFMMVVTHSKTAKSEIINLKHIHSLSYNND